MDLQVPGRRESRAAHEDQAPRLPESTWPLPQSPLMHTPQLGIRPFTRGTGWGMLTRLLRAITKSL